MKAMTIVDPAAESATHCRDASRHEEGGPAAAPSGHLRWVLGAGALREAVGREPFGFQHNLDRLGFFAGDALARLCKRYVGWPEDYFVSMGAAAPGEAFYAAPHRMAPPREALERLDGDHIRILLKRPERHEPAFASLLAELLGEIGQGCGCFDRQRLLRAESAVFISSAHTLTPFHFDPEMSFFCQIEGDKHYHVYVPAAVTEAELEMFYRGGVISIAELDLSRRDPSQERLFELKPGCGLHQPQNAPHWVETDTGRSVSYSVVFETDRSHALGQVRAFNHYWRRLGLTPAVPGRHPLLDAGKASLAHAAFPLRRGLRRIRR
jgi:hypothetical protein